MRLHRLRVSAFGPFPDSEEIDFDELNDAGLFLLTGPTGAGKTSILDAICFALYGQVPGVRGVKALKSQHAADDAKPEVELDFSIRDRRFVVRRSPEWSRPKRRGTGFTEEKSSATLLETTGGSEHFLSSRAQEVGHLISDLVGMQASQFVQVAMLPQGEFQAFLRASSQERHDVLQRLFKTDRFARIEEWVHDHSRRLRERSGTGEGQVQRILDTIADRAVVPLPEELSGAQLAASTTDGQVLPWVRSLLGDAETRLTDARQAQLAAAEAVAAARADHAEATRRGAAVARRDEARAALAALDGAQSAEDAARAALQADDRASRCTPLLRMLDDAVRRRDHGVLAWEAARTELAALDGTGLDLPDTLTSQTLTDLERSVRARTTRLEALLPRERAVREAEQAVARTEQALAERRRLADDGGRRLAELPDQLGRQRDRVATATSLAQSRDRVAQDLDRARGQLEAAELVPGRQAELVRLQDENRNARDRAAQARQTMQDLVARRLAGIAAELAGRLEDGQPCQVCGSAEHPRPAAPATDAVTEADQDRATAAFERLDEEYAASTRKATEAQRLLDACTQASGSQAADTLRARVTELEASLADAEAAESERPRLEEQVAALEEEQKRLTAQVHTEETEAATLEQVLERHRATIAEGAAEIAEVVGAPAGPALPERIDRLGQALAAVTRATEGLSAHEDAVQRAAELDRQAADAATEAGFESVTDLRSALLGSAHREQLEQLLAERTEQRSRAELLLEDPEVRAVAEQEPPDLDASATAVAAGEERERAAARDLHQEEQLVTSLRGNLTRLEEAIVAWSPVRDDYVRADAMSKLVRGMGGDNHLQMRLSAYVLATRLDQVVAAANERLGHMRDQRYLLQRTDRAARKGSQAGLGLEVVDEWTGDVRAPSSLSGGETFVVSLSLALGLADVVTQEAGGTEIETLFIDEGFGMLDADTLDDVMDRLDGLRAGGRTVGVVSHVTEVRNRIPTQVHVEKGRTGSAVTVRTMVA
jgi:exonuclease SbcC